MVGSPTFRHYIVYIPFLFKLTKILFIVVVVWLLQEGILGIILLLNLAYSSTLSPPTLALQARTARQSLAVWPRTASHI